VLIDVSATPEEIGSIVREAIAAASEVDVATLNNTTPFLALHMDSLTMVTIVSQIENFYGATFEVEELAEILRARDVADLVAAVGRKIGAAS
jgi:acyl carrier protein